MVRVCAQDRYQMLGLVCRSRAGSYGSGLGPGQEARVSG